MSEGNNGLVYLTRERLVELENELHRLKVQGRAEIAGKIAEARGHGDLSENSEYEVAKETQQHHELKIAKLEQMLSRVRILEPEDIPTDRVYILTNVNLRDLRADRTLWYRMVSPEEADFDQNRISVTSPIGKGLLGKKIGDTVEIAVPAGKLRYEILEITR